MFLKKSAKITSSFDYLDISALIKTIFVENIPYACAKPRIHHLPINLLKLLTVYIQSGFDH